VIALGYVRRSKESGARTVSLATGRFRTPSTRGERFDPCFGADTRYWLIIISIISELRTCLPATIAFQDWEGAQDFQS
jgi:hypothetical protein